MRMMLKVQMDVQAASNAAKNGLMQKVISTTVERLKPEASYFLTEDGKRTACLFFDLKDPSQMPAIAEPLFMTFGAAVTVTPVMNFEDLQKGLQAVQPIK